jgi:hypothetical protein
MIRYKLAATIFTEVILFAIAFLSVFGYGSAMAMGAIDVYGYFTSS